jgi:hypothetical protein
MIYIIRMIILNTIFCAGLIKMAFQTSEAWFCMNFCNFYSK